MYNLLISMLFWAAVAVPLDRFTTLSPWIPPLIGMGAFAVVYLLLTRRVMKKVGQLAEIAQRDLQANRAEKAIKTLESGLKYGPWQFYVKPQLNAQIGTVYYLKKDFGKAFDYLQKAFVRHWVAMGMLAICYMKRNKVDQMSQTFDKAVSASRKEPFLWNLYAYCLDHVGQTSKAKEILRKGMKKAGADERLQASLDALEAGKKMKMSVYGDLWYQFHLEKTGALIKQQTKMAQGRRKIVRR